MVLVLCTPSGNALYLYQVCENILKGSVVIVRTLF